MYDEDKQNSKVLTSIKNFFDTEAGDKIKDGFDDVTSTIKSSFTTVLGNEANEIVNDVKSIATGTYKIFRGFGEILFKRNNSEMMGSFSDDILDLDASITQNFRHSTSELKDSFKFFGGRLTRELNENELAISKTNNILSSDLSSLNKNFDNVNKTSNMLLGDIKKQSEFQNKKMIEITDYNTRSEKAAIRTNPQKQKKGFFARIFGFSPILAALGFSIGYFESELNKALKAWQITVAGIIKLDWLAEPFKYAHIWLKQNVATEFAQRWAKTFEKIDNFLKEIGLGNLLEVRPWRVVQKLAVGILEKVDNFFGFSDTLKFIKESFAWISDKFLKIRRFLNADFLTIGQFLKVRSVMTGFAPFRLLGKFLSKFLEPILYMVDLFTIWTDDSMDVSTKILRSIEMAAYRVVDFFLFLPLLVAEYIINPILEWLLSLFGVDIDLPNWYMDLEDFFWGITDDFKNLFDYLFFGKAWSDFSDWISSITLADVFGTSIKILKNIILMPFRLLKDIFTAIFKVFKWMFYWLTPYGYILAAYDLLGSFFESEMFAKTGLKEKFGFVIDKFLSIKSLVFDIFMMPFNYLYDSFDKWWNDPNEKNFWEKFVDQFKELWEDFKEFWTAPLDKIGKVIKDFWNDMFTFGSSTANAAPIPVEPAKPTGQHMYRGQVQKQSTPFNPSNRPIPGVDFSDPSLVKKPTMDTSSLGIPEKGTKIYGTWRPYQINGNTYNPLQDLSQYKQTAPNASWYSPGDSSHRTANSEYFDGSMMTAAHKTLPMGSIVKVTNLDNGKSEFVRINDRGPYHPDREIDLSKAAAGKLGMEKSGTAKVKVEPIGIDVDPFANTSGANTSGVDAMKDLSQEAVDIEKKKAEELAAQKAEEAKRQEEMNTLMKKQAKAGAPVINTTNIASNSSGGTNGQGTDIPDTIENATMALANWCLT